MRRVKEPYPRRRYDDEAEKFKRQPPFLIINSEKIMSCFSLIDTHAHLYFEDFEDDQTEIIKRCRDGIFPVVQGKKIGDSSHQFQMKAIISPGISLETSQQALFLAQKYPFIYPAVGIHPNHTENISDDIWNEIEKLASRPVVVAIGETGLDLYWNRSPLETQIDFLQRHIILAKRNNLPIIIHCRDAIQELLPLLRENRQNEEKEKNRSNSTKCDDQYRLRGVIHSFSEGPEIAEELVELGFYLGFAGGLTFTNKKFAQIGESIKRIPIHRILLETDSPFLTPHPFRGKLERNEPLMTAFIAKRAAELRGISNEELIAQTTLNAQTLFRLECDKVQNNINFSNAN